MVEKRPYERNAFAPPPPAEATLVRRVIYDRVSFLFMVALAAAFLLLGRAESVVVETSRSMVTDILAPVLETVAAPVTAMTRAIDNTRAMFSVHEENQRLRDEIASLRGWEMAARKYEAENKSLKRMMDVKIEANPVVVTARVIADTSTPFVRSLILNEGVGAGIEKGQAVHSERGLVGRIDGVSRAAARVLLVTDLNSRIPVKLDGDNARGIASGTNGALLRLGFLPPDAAVKPGQMVVTSGDGGLFPADIPVGLVESNDEKGVLIRPLADLTRLDYVKVLDLPHWEGPPKQGDDRGLPRLQGGLIGPDDEMAGDGAAPLVQDATGEALGEPDMRVPTVDAPRPNARPER